jgi:hypothetical protein
MSAQLAATSLAEIPYVSPSATTTDKSLTPKLARHARKCIICHHPDRLQIEDDFLHWRACTAIASSYGLPDRRAVYRHARATGLYRRRMRNMRIASSYIVQHAERIDPSAQAIINAVRACSVIDASGVWNEPVQHVIIEHVHTTQPHSDSPDAAPEIAASASAKTPISNVYSMQLEFAATPTKQTPAPTSNVYFPVQAPRVDYASDRGAHPLAESAVATPPKWLQLCPDFIRDRIEKKVNFGKAASSHPPCVRASRTP